MHQTQLKASQARLKGSFLSLGFKPRAESFQSFPGQFVEGAYQTIGDGDEQIKQEAAQVTNAMKTSFLAYVSGFNQPAITSKMSVKSKGSRKGSVTEFYDARSRTNSDNSHRSGSIKNKDLNSDQQEHK